MDDLKNKFRERWQQKRKKASNWTGLLIKVFILVALVFVINKLSRSDNIDWSKFKSTPDAVQSVPDSVKGQ